MRILPAAGLAAAELRARLPDVMYTDMDRAGDEDAASQDAGRRAAQNAQLVHAFGSARRFGHCFCECCHFYAACDADILLHFYPLSCNLETVAHVTLQGTSTWSAVATQGGRRGKRCCWQPRQRH
jgi:hypothetical protein